MATGRNPAISLCRVCSMVMIVLCHIIHLYTFIPGHAFLGDILNVGVYSFFVISGYLYGTKSITDFSGWICRRYIAVAVPPTILTLVVLLLQFLGRTELDAISVIIQLLNLQGLGFLIPGFYQFFHQAEVLGPLWFITVIMLCYCTVPALQYLRERVQSWKPGYLICIAASMVCYCITLLTGVSLVYFMTFAIGYFLAASGRLKQVRKLDLAVLSVFMLIFQVLRLALRAACDGTPVYQTFTLYSHMVLGIWIVYFFFAVGQLFPKAVSRLADSKVISAANDMSMYIYLTHYCFCRGALSIYGLTSDLFLATAGFFICTLLASLALKCVSGAVQQALTKQLRA